MLNIGSPAPDFELYDTDKQLVSLESLRGKTVLLLFFPLAFTSVCTKELCSVRDNIALYNSNNAEVFGISVDSTYALAKFKEEQKLNFSLLSDYNKTASAAYESLYEKFGNMVGVSKRSAFVIDRNGILQYMEVLENAGEVPNFEKIKNIIENQADK